MPRRRLALWVLAASGLVLASALAVVVLPRQGAIRCLLTFVNEPVGAEGETPAGYARREDPDRLGVRRAYVARPDREAPHSVLVFVHGITDQGIADGRVIQAVEAFRRGGFLVVAPELRLLVEPPLADDDVERLVRLFEAIADGAFPETRTRRIGVVGISVGGAVALRAVARFAERGGQGIRAVLAIGSPDDLRREIDTWFRLPPAEPDAPDGFERARRHDAEFARNVVFRAALSTRVPSAADRRVLKEWLEDRWSPEARPAGLATAEGNAFADLVLAGVERWAAESEALTRDAWDLLRAFSPADAGAGLRHLAGIACFLLHGRRDSLVAIEELERLGGRLRRYTTCVELASNMLGHTAVDDTGWTEQLAHVVFLDDFFDIVGR